MSKENQSQFPFARVLTPAAGSNEPNLWFQELRLLRHLSGGPSDEIRKISLKPGDTIFLRPDQSEALFLQFGDIAVFDGGEIAEFWPTLPVSA